MNKIKNNCPNCGAHISIPKEERNSSTYTCPYCSSLLRIEPDPDASIKDFSDTAHFRWKIEVLEKSIPETTGTFRGWNKVVFLPLFLFPVIIFFFISKNINFPGFFFSGDIACSGTDLIQLVNKNISSIEASGNCRVILNGVKVNTDSPAIIAGDNTEITIVNSQIKTKRTAIRAKDYAKISIVSSTVMSDTTAFDVKGNARIKLSSSTARGKINLFIKEKSAGIDLHNSSVKGNKLYK
jgi:DNA-directed RNA polymerase subunit RPC12/RpoP